MTKLNEIQKLRQAAAEWVAGVQMRPFDPQDKAFRKLDNRLQKAAIQFAKAHAAKQ